MGKWKQAHHRWLDPDYFGDDDENFITLPTGERVLRDGGRMKISMMAMDSVDAVLKATAADMQRRRGGKRGFSDADAKTFGLVDGRQLHRPGWRFRTDHAADEKIALGYAIHDQQDERAWLGDKAAPADSEGLTREQAYALKDAADREAWKLGNQMTDATGAGDAPVPGAMRMSNTMRPGMSCTINGNRGMMVETSPGSGWLTCEPIASDDGYFRETSDAATVQKKHREKMASLYDAYDREQSEAWRGGK